MESSDRAIGRLNCRPMATTDFPGTAISKNHPGPATESDRTEERNKGLQRFPPRQEIAGVGKINSSVKAPNHASLHALSPRQPAVRQAVAEAEAREQAEEAGAGVAEQAVAVAVSVGDSSIHYKAILSRFPQTLPLSKYETRD